MTKYSAILLFLFSGLLLAGCQPAAAPVSIGNRPVSINDVPLEDTPLKPIEDMTWTNFDGATNADGEKTQLKDLRGKVVILDFWATYCPPCIEEIPHLRELQAKYGRENLEVIGLHVGGAEDRPNVPEFAQKLAIDYPLATPEDQLSRFVFGKRDDIPQTAVFDRSGNLVEKFVGFSEPIKANLDAAVERAINQKQ